MLTTTYWCWGDMENGKCCVYEFLFKLTLQINTLQADFSWVFKRIPSLCCCCRISRQISGVSVDNGYVILIISGQIHILSFKRCHDCNFASAINSIACFWVIMHAHSPSKRGMHILLSVQGVWYDYCYSFSVIYFTRVQRGLVSVTNAPDLIQCRSIAVYVQFSVVLCCSEFTLPCDSSS